MSQQLSLVRFTFLGDRWNFSSIFFLMCKIIFPAAGLVSPDIVNLLIFSLGWHQRIWWRHFLSWIQSSDSILTSENLANNIFKNRDKRKIMTCLVILGGCYYFCICCFLEGCFSWQLYLAIFTHSSFSGWNHMRSCQEHQLLLKLHYYAPHPSSWNAKRTCQKTIMK